MARSRPVGDRVRRPGRRVSHDAVVSRRGVVGHCLRNLPSQHMKPTGRDRGRADRHARGRADTDNGTDRDRTRRPGATILPSGSVLIGSHVGDASPGGNRYYQIGIRWSFPTCLGPFMRRPLGGRAPALAVTDAAVRVLRPPRSAAGRRSIAVYRPRARPAESNPTGPRRPPRPVAAPPTEPSSESHADVDHSPKYPLCPSSSSSSPSPEPSY